MDTGPLKLLRKKFTIEWRQTEAIEKARKKGSPNVRVFAFEDPNFKPGCRKFVVSELRDFYLWYRECPLRARHFYELIVERMPCRLYFDLEFNRQLNPGLDALAMMDDFLSVCCDMLWRLCDINVHPKRDFLILDSSSEVKFSAHVIAQIHRESPSAATTKAFPKHTEEMLFRDNSILKLLVMHFCSTFEREKRCIVKTGEQKMGYFCDLSVYSRNRNFRLFQSRKCGKEQTLRLADYCTFYDYYDRCITKEPKNAQIFLDSLITPFNFDAMQIIDVGKIAEIQKIERVVKTSTHHILSSLATDNGQCQLANQENIQGNLSCPVSESTSSSVCPSVCSGAKTFELAGGPPPSPFPLLDDFMLCKFRAFNTQAEIRVWRFVRTQWPGQNDEKATNVDKTTEGKYEFHLQYQLTNSRFCLNRGREHQSNNVYWVVDLHALHFLQRCFDKVDCPNFASPAFALSVEMCEYLRSCVQSVFRQFKIPFSQCAFLNNDLLAKRYKASTDSFNKSSEWERKYGHLSFLELNTPCDEYEEEKENAVEGGQTQKEIK